ncbi:MAG: methyltransferase domain-containing protein [Saprospiraceae bacterium]|nr:methyltransferase domain-containing protein [Saprospiraceae bacterium]
MKKFQQLKKIKEIYENGENIIQYLKGIGQNEINEVEDILISYDFQAGSYIQAYSKNKDYLEKYCRSLASIINKFEDVQSILEIGVGEATTLYTLLKYIKNRPSEIFGFDISWSRLKFGKELLKDLNSNDVKLFTANLFEIPLQDSSVDIVYSSHSVEPNGGKELEALKELYRITKKYLILLEPAYEFANEIAKARMKKYGYVTELYATAKNLGYKIIEHRLFDYTANPLNPTGLLIIEKNETNSNKADFICPVTQTPLEYYSDSLLYSKESFLAYPIIDGIPCLLKDNSILATHLLTDYSEYKTKEHIIY